MTTSSPTSAPSRSISFSIKDNNYHINYPNTGSLIDMEVMKVSLSRNTYDGIVSSRSTKAQYVQFIIDTIATFTVLCPSLRQDLKIAAFTELNVEDMNQLVKIYIEVVLPWLNEWERFLNQSFS